MEAKKYINHSKEMEMFDDIKEYVKYHNANHSKQILRIGAKLKRKWQDVQHLKRLKQNTPTPNALTKLWIFRTNIWDLHDLEFFKKFYSRTNEVLKIELEHTDETYNYYLIYFTKLKSTHYVIHRDDISEWITYTQFLINKQHKLPLFSKPSN